jgi:hypothetical protein
MIKILIGVAIEKRILNFSTLLKGSYSIMIKAYHPYERHERIVRQEI